MNTSALVIEEPGRLALRSLGLVDPAPEDVLVEVDFTGISTGTERLLWSGAMPPFPGMGYPLVPGYEAVGRVIQAGPRSRRRVGDRVFVPGSSGFIDARGLFGASARRLVVPGDRAVPLDSSGDPELGTLMALAATALHAVERSGLPDLIVGHGVLGRLIARITCAMTDLAPTVWEIQEARRAGEHPYPVIHPDDDERKDYRRICDVSGDASLLDGLLARLIKGGEVVLAGFYHQPVSFAFPVAFMKEARISVAAEWVPDDLRVVTQMVEAGDLSLEGLISHRAPAAEAPEAYPRAFDDPSCLKMILDWRDLT